MVERKQLEFFLVRYVPDEIKGEFVNIGLVMSETNPASTGFAEVKFTHDWSRARCLDPDVDIAALQALERDIRGQLSELKDHSVLLKWLNDSFSNMVQVSEVKGCLCTHPEAEMIDMARMYLESRRIVPTDVPGEEIRRQGGPRQRILRRMEDEWKQEGVWEFLLKDLPVAQYAEAGDPFKFDFGYPVRNDIRLFQAVSLKTNAVAAERLAYKYPEIADGMWRRDQVRSVLTAIVDDDFDRQKNHVRYAFHAMQANGLIIAAVSEMPAIAKLARQELNLSS